MLLYTFQKKKKNRKQYQNDMILYIIILYQGIGIPQMRRLYVHLIISTGSKGGERVPLPLPRALLI